MNELSAEHISEVRAVFIADRSVHLKELRRKLPTKKFRRAHPADYVARAEEMVKKTAEELAEEWVEFIRKYPLAWADAVAQIEHDRALPNFVDLVERRLVPPATVPLYLTAFTRLIYMYHRATMPGAYRNYPGDAPAARRWIELTGENPFPSWEDRYKAA